MDGKASRQDNSVGEMDDTKNTSETRYVVYTLFFGQQDVETILQGQSVHSSISSKNNAYIHSFPYWRRIIARLGFGPVSVNG